MMAFICAQVFALSLWFHVASTTPNVRFLFIHSAWSLPHVCCYNVIMFSPILSPILTVLKNCTCVFNLHVNKLQEQKNTVDGWRFYHVDGTEKFHITLLHPPKKRLGLELEWLLPRRFLFSFASKQLVISRTRIYFQLDQGQLILSEATLVVLTAHPLRSP